VTAMLTLLIACAGGVLTIRWELALVDKVHRAVH